jgi:omega-amidase
MQDLSISLLQTPLYWHQPDANRAHFEELIWQVPQGTQLILLPEMFTTGFSMAAAEQAEPMNSTTFRWLRQQAAQSGAVVCGSYIVKENGRHYNRLIWMEPDGQWASYDKRHLFRMAQEEQHYAPGNLRLVREWQGWRICPLICYDLRFPVWSRNRRLVDGGLEYDLLLYVANWPQARVTAWDSLLQARAIENLAYCAGLNRTGSDDNGIAYNGSSAIFDFKGQRLAHSLQETEILSYTLSGHDLLSYREKFPAHQDADSFSLDV